MAYSIIKNGNNYNAGAEFRVYQITNRDDIENLPTNCAPGSMAFPTDESFKYKLSNEGVWTEVTIPVDFGELTGDDGMSMDWGTI